MERWKKERDISMITFKIYKCNSGLLGWEGERPEVSSSGDSVFSRLVYYNNQNINDNSNDKIIMIHHRFLFSFSLTG